MTRIDGSVIVSDSNDDRSYTAGEVITAFGAKTEGLTLDANQKITLTDAQNTGSINRLITLNSTYDVDRPWISWVDETGRHSAATGYHTKLTQSEGGTTLKQYEVKTVADATSQNPGEMRTRLAIQCGVQRGTWGVNFIDNFEVNQGENPITADLGGSIVPAGLRIRLAPQDTFTSSNFVGAQFMAEMDASDNVIGFLDVNVPYTSGGSLFPGNKTATLDIFRNTHTSSASSPQISVKKGDGSNTNALVFTAPSGLFELPLALTGTTGIKLGGDASATLYRSASATIKTDAALAVAGNLGVNGTAPVAKPTVTGAKGSNAALGSLLTALASYGLITDSTTT